MKLFKISILVIAITLFIISGCDLFSEAEQQEPYVVLNVGDVREYYVLPDSTYLISEIIRKTKRTDGLEVYEWEFTAEDYSSSSYLFIRDGYLFGTELDTTIDFGERTGNPYNEQRIAKVFPKVGDKFIQVDGVPDSLNSYMTVYTLKQLRTQAHNFKNVFSFKILGEEDWDFRVHYAENYGHIGTTINSQNEKSSILVNYLNVGGKEFGTFIPINSIKSGKNVDMQKLMKRVLGINIRKE